MQKQQWQQQQAEHQEQEQQQIPAANDSQGPADDMPVTIRSGSITGDSVRSTWCISSHGRWVKQQAELTAPGTG